MLRSHEPQHFARVFNKTMFVPLNANIAILIKALFNNTFETKCIFMRQSNIGYNVLIT